MENNITDYTLGAGAGYLSYKGATKLGIQIRKPYSINVIKQMKNFSNEEKVLLKKATYDGFNISGLGSKPNRYYLHDVNLENFEDMTKLMKRKLSNLSFIKKLKKLKGNRRPLNAKEKEELANKLNKYIKNKEYKKAWQEFKNACKGKPVKINEIEIKTTVKKILKPITSPDLKDKIVKSDKRRKLASKMKMVANGENAFCSPLTRDIMVNMDKLSGASFHEMGHALNASGSKAIKTLAIGRHITKALVPVILAIGLLKPKKKEGQEPNGIIDKTTTFIKNNAGKLTFAALIPTLAEEGLASIRGGQIAKKVLNPKLLKKINRNNFLAWTTYLAGALITTGAIALSIKIRDKIAQK